MTVSFANMRHSEPKRSDENPVVSFVLNQYKACFVSPNHLLYGLARDYFYFLRKLLPSKHYRVAIETELCISVCFLNLKCTLRIFHHSKRRIHSFYMATMYILIIIFDYVLEMSAVLHKKSLSGNFR